MHERIILCSVFSDSVDKFYSVQLSCKGPILPVLLFAKESATISKTLQYGEEEEYQESETSEYVGKKQ